MVTFILTGVGISLSGVLAPGPITAATLAAGTRSRHAGLLIALGHIAVELPAIVFLLLGLGTLLESPGVRASIGLAGGAFLLLMGLQLLLSLRSAQEDSQRPAERHPFWTGALLTATSPYFWLWAATVGLTLTTQALEFGLAVLVLLASLHWLCDLGWLEVLSQAGFKGSQRFGERGQRFVWAVCAIMLFGFGLKFLFDAGKESLPRSFGGVSTFFAAPPGDLVARPTRGIMATGPLGDHDGASSAWQHRDSRLSDRLGLLADRRDDQPGDQRRR